MKVSMLNCLIHVEEITSLNVERRKVMRKEKGLLPNKDKKIDLV